MTRKLNPENEVLKRRYLTFLAHSKGRHSKTIDKAAAAIALFEKSTGWRSFKSFQIEQAHAFKEFLAAQTNQRTGKHLSEGTRTATLRLVRKFFFWLADQPNYRSKITYSKADNFTPSRADQRKARAQSLAKGPTVEQVRMVIAEMPATTTVEKRDRALIAFTLLTGSRVSATASLRLKHVDLTEGCVFMDAREVATKNAKTFTTWFFDVGDDILDIFADWVDHLLHVERFGPEDPIFPRTLVRPGASRRFEATGLDRKQWASPQPIEKIFKRAFAAAGLPYFNPHSFRNTLTRLGYDMCRGDFKALKVWSQNFAHDSMLTTYLGYGTVGPTEHAEVMKSLRVRGRASASPVDQTELAELLRRNLELQG